MWFKRPNFEKLKQNLRKGILKGIYWILTGLRVGILYEFCVVLLRDLFYYTWRCGRTRKSWALGAPNAHSDGRMSPAFSDAVFLFALCALLCLLSVWPGTCWFNLNRLRLIQHRSPRASRLLFIVAF